jgi:hypothetical protein
MSGLERLRKVAERADATNANWPGMYKPSSVARHLTGQDDDGYAEAEHIAAFDPPTCIAMLDIISAAARVRDGSEDYPEWENNLADLGSALDRLSGVVK